jgi:hypothetical protein
MTDTATETELADLRHRLAVLEDDRAATEAAEAELARRRSLSRSEWEQELVRRQDEKMGLPWRWLEDAQATGERLLGDCGLKLTVAAPTVTAGSKDERDAALEWWGKRNELMEKYRDVLRVQRLPDEDRRLPRNDLAYVAAAKAKNEARAQERSLAGQLATLGIKK